uniref:Uncharacterized protein n=1 Tax=Timema monikensis TaxID=170555 RepID=A0A7R9E6V5_9NEOP|nr:unnamed protein product [Timema monikensis]
MLRKLKASTLVDHDNRYRSILLFTLEKLMGSKTFKKIEREDIQTTKKKLEAHRVERTEKRRVMVLKKPTVLENDTSFFNITLSKEEVVDAKIEELTNEELQELAQNPSPESDSEEDKPSCTFTTKSMAIAFHQHSRRTSDEIYKENKCAAKKPTIRAFFQPVAGMVRHEGDKIMGAQSNRMKRSLSPLPAKIPIHLRLGLPSMMLKSSESREVTKVRRRRNKSKLKRNVILSGKSGDQVLEQRFLLRGYNMMNYSRMNLGVTHYILFFLTLNRTKYGHVMREKEGRREVGIVEEELLRKSARAAVLIARGIEPTTVRSFVNIEVLPFDVSERSKQVWQR